MLDYRIALGNAIKAARTELNLTLNEVADLINSDSRTVLNIENYKGNPKMEKLFLLIRSLHIDPSIVFYPEKSTSPQSQNASKPFWSNAATKSSVR